MGFEGKYIMYSLHLVRIFSVTAVTMVFNINESKIIVFSLIISENTEK